MADSSRENSFLYFAYGSNLNEQRIHISNPSAQFHAIANLKDYKLAFGHASKRWGGHVANIVPQFGESVWGVIWSLDMKHLSTLDKQEGVHLNVYQRISVDVTTDKQEPITCISYEQVKSDTKSAKPSPQYKQVILSGARQFNLPADYITKLERIEDNGYNGKIAVQIDV